MLVQEIWFVVNYDLNNLKNISYLFIISNIFLSYYYLKNLTKFFIHNWLDLRIWHQNPHDWHDWIILFKKLKFSHDWHNYEKGRYEKLTFFHLVVLYTSLCRLLQSRYPDQIQDSRGVGLLCAMDCPDTDSRTKLLNKLKHKGNVIYGTGRE